MGQAKRRKRKRRVKEKKRTGGAVKKQDNHIAWRSPSMKQACKSMIDWCRAEGIQTMRDAWAVCHRADWMLATVRTMITPDNELSHSLHQFNLDCAERALQCEHNAGRDPDPRSWAALDAKQDWLIGAITAEELGVAAAAAKSARTEALAVADAAEVRWDAADTDIADVSMTAAHVNWAASRNATSDILRSTVVAAKGAKATHAIAWSVASAANAALRATDVERSPQDTFDIAYTVADAATWAAVWRATDGADGGGGFAAIPEQQWQADQLRKRLPFHHLESENR